MTKKRNIYRSSRITHRVSPFSSKVTIIITSDIQMTGKREDFLKDITVSESMLAFTATSTTGRVYIVLPENVKPATIVHESYHAIRHVLEYHRVENDEEVFAYHLDDLFEVISAFVKKYRRKKRKFCPIRQV